MSIAAVPLSEVSPVSNALRVAILGFWHVHATDYANDILDHPDAELVAVWDHDAERGRAAAATFRVDFIAELDALLARDELDGVVVTTETSLHLDVMLRAANAGLHIFTEKVLAPKVAEAESIVAAVNAAGTVLVVSLPRLYTGYTAALDEILEDRLLGRIVYGRVRLSHDGAVASDGQPAWLPERF